MLASIPFLPILQGGMERSLTWEHFGTHVMQSDQDPIHLSAWWEKTVLCPRSRKKKEGISMACDLHMHAGIYEMKETEESSIISRDRLHMSL